jgi:hypothetical protein
MSYRLPHGLPLASWIAVALATVVAASVLARTMRIALPPAPVPIVHNESRLRQSGEPVRARPAPRILANDPFRAGRALPTEHVAEVAPDTVLPVSVVAIRLIGTVVLRSGSFAICQLPADAPRIVHVGERLGELTLIILEPGRAVFQAPKGARLDLSLVTPRS